jgi:hypothetical protein
MLRILHPGRSLPTQRTLDPNAIFIAGMIGQLKFVGNEIVLGVSDGTAPFGVIEDTRAVAHVAPAIDEPVVIVPAVGETVSTPNGLALSVDKIAFLQNANILQHSFVSTKGGVELIAVNGAVRVLAGTLLNAIVDPGSSSPDSFVTHVRYSYYVPNRPGDDSTMGSSKVSVWANPAGAIFSTDQFEPAVPYPLNAGLYVSLYGKLTTQQLMENQPAVAMVCVPPTRVNESLEFIWL